MVVPRGVAAVAARTDDHAQRAGSLEESGDGVHVDAPGRLRMEMSVRSMDRLAPTWSATGYAGVEPRGER